LPFFGGGGGKENTDVQYLSTGATINILQGFLQNQGRPEKETRATSTAVSHYRFLALHYKQTNKTKKNKTNKPKNTTTNKAET